MDGMAMDGMAMDVVRGRGSRRAAMAIAIVAAASLLLQYALLIASTRDTIGPALATLRFVSYFTILSNLLVAIATGGIALRRRGAVACRCSQASVLAAIAVYIGVTGAIYVAVLRHLWQPQGAQWWADGGLHYATPALYLAWWASGLRHGALRAAMAMRWLMFPALYLAWCVLRGAWLHEYPYPFIDVDALGARAVAINAMAMLGVFLLAAALVIGIDRLLSTLSVPAQP